VTATGGLLHVKSSTYVNFVIVKDVTTRRLTDSWVHTKFLSQANP
jgi:hypothetical protein